MRYPRLLITGTDTNVGKTFVGAGLVQSARGRGVDARGFKLVETGVGPEGPRDAQALWDAAGRTTALPLVGATFPLPAAPSLAARAAGRILDVDEILDRLAAHDRAAAFLIAEGAGGLLVPFTDTLLFADIATRIGWPLLVVARARLGTLNHTLLSLREAERRDLHVAAVVMIADGPPAPPQDGALSADSHVQELRRFTDVPVFGPVRHLDAPFSHADAASALEATGLAAHLTLA